MIGTLGTCITVLILSALSQMNWLKSENIMGMPELSTEEMIHGEH